ncbi:MAG: hypothetical protein JRI68_24760 [Deltaproteobacteria bacterium]|nr:hypothetical protein [Deltaproteobacteria bacterium]
MPTSRTLDSFRATLRRAPRPVGWSLVAAGALVLAAGPSEAASTAALSHDGSQAGSQAGPQAAALATRDLATMNGEGYEVTVNDASGAVGDPTAIVVVIKATGQYKVNAKYPHKVKLAEPPAGLELPQRILKRDDGKLDDAKTFTFRIPAKASKAGSFAVTGKLKFSVCDASSCLIKKEALAATVTAK